jgi:hypothetical protein
MSSPQTAALQSTELSTRTCPSGHGGTHDVVAPEVASTQFSVSHLHTSSVPLFK